MNFKIICDENIAFAQEAFSQFGELTLLPGRKINNNHLLDADILIVRSVTNVNEELLRGTKVKFVGTATIGTDHLDKEFLIDKKIHYASAPGCNSYAVSEWVIASTLNIINKYKLRPKTAAVIGCGNIGSKVSRLFEAIDLKVKIVDPVKAELEKINSFYNIDNVLDCDIITFHTPMAKHGKYPTYHLMNSERISKLKENTILINSSRGAVVDNYALLTELKKRNIYTALDVWENEPDISLELLKNVNIATPHIAGYSLEGKVNGTKMIYDVLCNFLDLKNEWQPKLPILDSAKILTENLDFFNMLNKIVEQIYQIENDDDKLRINPNIFDLLRKNYDVRREFNNYTVTKNDLDETILKILSIFRINLM